MKRTIIFSLTLALLSQVCYSKQWIIFCGESISSDSPTGHAYIAFFKENVELKQTVHVASWGFYPKKNNAEVLWGEIFPAAIKDDYMSDRDAIVTIEVTLEEYKRCWEVVNAWKTQAEELRRQYQAYSQNCIAFVRDVASVLPRIKQPHGAYFTPSLFIEKLKTMNVSLEDASAKNFKRNEIFYGQEKAKELFTKSKAEKINISPEITWISWKDLPESDKTALKGFYTFETETVYDDILQSIEDGCEIKVAVVDLDNDGKKGYLTYKFSCMEWCGTGGCTLDAYENNGKKKIHLLVHEEDVNQLKKRENGLLTSKGKFIPLKAN